MTTQLQSKARSNEMSWHTHGLRRTQARELLLGLLRDALRKGRHLDAKTLFQRALSAGEHVSMGTVYRVLKDFEQL